MCVLLHAFGCSDKDFIAEMRSEKSLARRAVAILETQNKTIGRPLKQQKARGIIHTETLKKLRPMSRRVFCMANHQGRAASPATLREIRAPAVLQLAHFNLVVDTAIPKEVLRNWNENADESLTWHMNVQCERGNKAFRTADCAIRSAKVAPNNGHDLYMDILPCLMRYCKSTI